MDISVDLSMALNLAAGLGEGDAPSGANLTLFNDADSAKSSFFSANSLLKSQEI